MTKETLNRSIIKSLCWRAIATATTFSITYIIENNIDSAIKISLFDCTINFTLHVLYERGFAHIQWGYIDQ